MRKVELDLTEVRRLYEEEELSAEEIAERMGCSRETVARRLRAMGVRLTRTGRRNARFNHRRWLNRAGYWVVRLPDGGEMYEHRLVAEEMLGRPLTETEVVHHINEVKWDNRPENLMVLQDQGAHNRLHGLLRRSQRSSLQLSNR